MNKEWIRQRIQKLRDDTQRKYDRHKTIAEGHTFSAFFEESEERRHESMEIALQEKGRMTELLTMIDDLELFRRDVEAALSYLIDPKTEPDTK